MLMTALMFRGALCLVSEGQQFKIKKCIGLRGTVYQQIPHQDTGKVNIVVNDITRELLARSHDGEEIASFTPIKIVDIFNNKIVIVSKIIQS